MEINSEELSKFLDEKINNHEKYMEKLLDDEYIEKDKYAQGYHVGSINAYRHIIDKFNLQRLF